MNFDHYGTMALANTYFSKRLHEIVWSKSTPREKLRALVTATKIIDKLAYKGNKATVHTVLEADENADQETIRAAETAQPLEFPRGADTEVPQAILTACYEIAHALRDGKNPEMELENLAISSQGASSVRTTFSRSQGPIEHLINGIPSAMAWRLIRPFLRDGDLLIVTRVS